MVAPTKLLEADIDHDPIKPWSKGPLPVEPPYRGEQLHEDLLSYVLCQVAVSNDPIRGTQDGQLVKLNEHFQPPPDLHPDTEVWPPAPVAVSRDVPPPAAML